MIIWQEFSAHSDYLSFEDIIKIICSLPNYNSNWSLSRKKTVEFSEHLGEVAGVLVNKKASAYFCINSKDQQTVHLSNIFSINKCSLVRNEYHNLETNFCDEVRKMLKKSEFRISIRCGPKEIGLKQIIPAKIPRKQFERYIGLFPTSYHPCDIKRLDAFICSAHRYCRREINTTFLKSFLLTDLKWNLRDADWCIDRIEAGFEILEARKEC